MSNKRNFLSILGVTCATVIAAGGSAFLTNTALSLVEQPGALVKESESGLSEKETEEPITVETFAKTKDSFTIRKKGAQQETEKGQETEKTTETGSTSEGSGSGNGASADGSGVSGTTGDGSGGTGDGTGTEAGAGSGSTSGGNKATLNTYIEDEGYHVDAEGTTYYADGKGNLYYPGNNGEYYWAAGPGEKPSNVTIPPYSGSTSGGSGSSNGGSGGGSNGGSGGGSNGGSSGSAWDDSYMMYDIDSRYISADELSGWSSEDLAKLRNEIFARHGRIFAKQKWIDYFSQKTWYVPTYDPTYFDNNMNSFLNDCERANLNVILKVEDQLG